MAVLTCPNGCNRLVIRGINPRKGLVVLQEPWSSKGIAGGVDELWVTDPGGGPAYPVAATVAREGDLVGVLTHDCGRRMPPWVLWLTDQERQEMQRKLDAMRARAAAGAP